jgi:hypothetical protein
MLQMVLYSRLPAIRLVVSVRRVSSPDKYFADVNVKVETGVHSWDDADENKVFRLSRRTGKLQFAI